MYILFALFLAINSYCFTYERIFTNQAHTDLVTTASFFLDGARWITGSKDRKVQIWSISTMTKLHQLTFGDEITNVGLHPVDNRIFVLVYDGNINVYDPTTYAPITSFTHPNGNGNYMAFDVPNNRFIIGGYDGAGSAPMLHFYDATSYALVTSVTTNLPTGDEVNTMSVNAAGSHVVISNLATSITTYTLSVYRLSDNSLISTFNHNTDKIRWAIYDNYQNYFCTTSRDYSIRCYTYNSGTNIYINSKTWTAPNYPYCMNFGISNTILITIGSSLYFYDMAAITAFPPVYKILADTQPIFVLDSTINMNYLITGMQTGYISLWRYKYEANATEETTTQTSVNVGLIVGLVVGLTSLFTLAGLVIYCCFCGGLAKWRKEKKAQDQLSRHQLKSQLQGNENFIVIRQDSDKSSDIDYDQLMVHGTVIVIKDEEKKKKYLKKLSDNNKKTKVQQKQQVIGPDENQIGNLHVHGHIIIIRDDDHPLKKKKNTVSNDTDSDIDYQQLMAQGNIIIIKDDEAKKKLLKTLKKSNPSLDPLEAQGLVIIIKGDEEQRKYLKQLQKQKQIKNIKHDKILANGNILVISDKDKKKDFIEGTKKMLGNNLNNDKRDQDFKQLEVAEQIIVICGDDDDEEDYTYEQLMAQGTVIVIKDDDIIKDYGQFKQKQKIKSNKNINKRDNASDKSSNPDYDTLMAEQCIIVIKDDDDKRDYVKFMKQRKNRSQRSSNISYDELIKGGNIMKIGDNNDKQQKRRNNSDGNLKAKNISTKMVKIDPFQQMMAQKNVVAINEDGEMVQKNSVISNGNKGSNMRKQI